MNLNNTEKQIQQQLRQDVEIPAVVRDKVQETYHMIENHQVPRQKPSRSPYTWMKTTAKVLGGLAAVMALAFVFCITNPVMAKNLPLVGGLFAQLQDKVSFFGDFAGKATVLEETASDTGAGNTADTAAADGQTAGSPDTSDNGGSAEAAGVYTRTADGLTVTFSEVYANDMAIYLTMLVKSDEPFPETMMNQNDLGTDKPVMSMRYGRGYSFKENNEDTAHNVAYPEGVFLDKHTYSCILRIDLEQDSRDYTEYYKKHEEMTNEVLVSLGMTQEDLENLDDFNDEDYALLEQFNAGIMSRRGALEEYITKADVPEEFTLHLDISQFIGEKADPQYWDHGYTEEQLNDMSEEEWQEVMSQEPAEYSAFPNEHQQYWYDGPWSFEIPITIDTSQTVIQEINETNEDGIGLKSVVKTPYELTVYELYEEGGNSDSFLVALDANGNKLPYNDSAGNSNNFTIQDRDISTVDIYILDYIQYMDELKGPERYNNNENKPEEEKWSTLLSANAKYHKTLHF